MVDVVGRCRDRVVDQNCIRTHQTVAVHTTCNIVVHNFALACGVISDATCSLRRPRGAGKVRRDRSTCADWSTKSGAVQQSEADASKQASATLFFTYPLLMLRRAGQSFSSAGNLELLQSTLQSTF